MARLPDYTNLGGGAQSFATGRARPQAPGVNLDTNASALARGAKSIGASLNAIGEDYKREEDEVNTLKADAEWKAQRYEMMRTFEDDPDYQTYDQRFTPQAKAVAAKTASLIKDPKIRERFLLRAESDVTTDRDWLLSKSKGLARQSMVVEAEKALQKYRERHILAKTPEEEDQAIADIDAGIELLKRNGLATPEVEAKLRQEYVDGTQRKSIEARIDLADEKLRDEIAGEIERRREEGVAVPKGGSTIPYSGVLTSGASRGKPAGWAATDKRWAGLDSFQKAAAMALMEADGKDPESARNALGAMINRADKEQEDLGAHVSRSIYQPTIEPAQQRRLAAILASPAFKDLTEWAKRRAAGQEEDPVNGATHFLAHEMVMEQLASREPGKYRSWRGWSGYERGKGVYTNPDGGTVVRDTSHTFLYPEGKHSAKYDGGKGGETKVAGLKGEMNTATDAAPTPVARKPRFAHVPTDVLTDYMRQAEVKHGEVLAGRRSELKQQLDDDIESIRATGKPRQNAPELDVARKVLEPNQIATYEIKRKAAKMEWEATHDLDMLDNEALKERVFGLVPKAGSDDYALQSEVYRAAEAKKKDIIELRDRDPALSVNESPEVKAAVKAMDPESPDRSVLVRSRIEAQNRLGISRYDQRIITRDEAKALLDMGSADDMNEKEKLEALRAAGERAKAMYGPYASQAMNDAAKFYVRDAFGKDAAATIIKKLAMNEPIKARDYRQADEMEKIDNAERAFTAAPKPAARPPRSEAGPRREPSPAARQALVDNITKNPALAREFDRKYYAGAAAEVLFGGAR